MKSIVTTTARLIKAGIQIYKRKWSFLGVFAFVFLGSVVSLHSFDLLPETTYVGATPSVVLAAASTASSVEQTELPTMIQIPTIGLTSIITNPTTTDIAILDKQLLKGAVRYPTSATLGEAGNVVLFGHSSYFPIVGNLAYKSFNNIQKLVNGDVVTVYSLGTAYTYRVHSVTKESVTNNSGIDLSTADRILTLVTCDSFGAKTDRYVVVADFVESHSIPL